MNKFHIICASHDDSIFKRNLGATAFFDANAGTIVRDYSNVSSAYNYATALSKQLSANFYIYLHHDVYMDDRFEDNLKRAINEINAFDANWGVLGVAGARMENGIRKFYGHVKDRGHEWGSSIGLPQEVQTLDELLLITKGDLVFDEQFDLHFYGADICMQAIKLGRKNYAIDAYGHHNSGLKMGYRSQSFKDCEAKFRSKWKDFLPVVTTCSLIEL